MKKRKHIYFAASILVLALLFGAGVTYWIEPNLSTALAQNAQPINAIASPVTAEQEDLASILPTQEILSQLYDKVVPSVVNIQVTLSADAAVQPGLPFGDLPFGMPFELPDTPAVPHGQGSGFIYDMDGHIVTNNHVVENAESITVNFANGMWADAELVATDPQADLAVIKVEPPAGLELHPLVLAPSDGIRAGYYVAAMGSPFGLDETMTLGVVSALGRSVPTGNPARGTSTNYSLPDVVQTDTAINPGNSGGPLLNLKGEVVGVNFAINSTAGSNSGVGFAIPVSVVEKVVPALISDGAFKYSYLGIAGQTISAQVAAENEIDDNVLGVLVSEVVSDGPAAEAGIEVNDIIVGIGDQAVRQFEDLISYLFQSTEPGGDTTIHALRNGSEMSFDVELVERPAPVVDEPVESDERTEITIADAIKIAKAAVTDSELMADFESASAKKDTLNGQAVWIVSLSGDGNSATVIVDASNGEVLELNLE
jgi:2-alkenal reductase